MRKCARPTCTSPGDKAGYCESHYRKRLRAGYGGMVDAAPAVEHLRKLRDLGWTFDQIDTAAGIGKNVSKAIIRHGFTRIRKYNAEAIVRILPVRQSSTRSADATGTRRRVQALMWMGWTSGEIADRAGLVPSTLSAAISRGVTSFALAYQVAQVYEELCHKPGSSRITAGKARGYGYVPPAAWDGIDIDDPAARPNVDGYDEATVQALIAGQRPDYAPADLTEAVQRLSHLTYNQIAKQLRIPRPTCYSAARRAA